MNQTAAKKLVKSMLKKGASAYSGKHAFATALNVPLKKITPTAEMKLTKALLTEIVETNCRPAIEVLYAEEKLRSN